MNLHLKYRPTELKEIVGNRGVIESLTSILDREHAPHAFLFTGPSGCGKTTLARIVANKLGCEASSFIEVDSADFRGIDTIRDILRNMRLRPLSGDIRAWLLDEVHQLTKDGQSALLKALEDTPKHVYFLLATTEPQKLLKTIVNRCSVFNVQSLPESRLMYLLKRVADAEGVEIDREVFEQIAFDSLGSPRAALILLDKIIGLPPKRMLSTVWAEANKVNEAIDLCRALMNPKTKWPFVCQILAGLQEVEPERIRQTVLGYCNSVLLKEDSPRAYLIIDSFKEPFFNSRHAGISFACYQVLFK